MRLLLASDPYGASVHESLIEHLEECHSDIEITNLGILPYHEAASAVARIISMAEEPDIRGVICCGSGQGVNIVANKFPNVYAALCRDVNDARGARATNNSNVLCLGGRVTPSDDAREMLDVWLKTEFTEGWADSIATSLRQAYDDIKRMDVGSADAKSLIGNQKQG
jgi:ribose 5-phosphate isomerase B